MLLSLLVPVVFLAVGIHTRNDYGETWDEQFDQDIGRFYLNDWSKTGVAGLERRFIPLQRYYGPFFDEVVVAAHTLLHDRLGIVRNSVAAYHVPVLVASALGLWFVFWLGRRLWGTAEGFVSAVVLAIMPQFIAHSQNNLKDMPLAVLFTLSLLLLVEAVRRESMAVFAVAGVAAGLTFAIKLHALFLAPIVVLWQVPEIRLDFRRWGWLLRGLAVTAATACAAVLAVWPYFRHAPWVRFVELLQTFGNHEYNEYVFYLGQHFRAHEVPWHFPFVMLGVNTPIVHLFFLAVALGILVSRIAHFHPENSPLLLVTLWLLVPPFVQACSGAVMLDGVRHYLLVLPAIALLAGYAVCRAGGWVAGTGRRRPWLRAAYVATVGASLVAVVGKDVAIHPYEVAFFNRLTGGTAGASSRFELDYWGQSLAATAAWMNANLPTRSRVWLTIPGQHFFRLDRSRLRFVNDLSGLPNYKVSLIRGLLKTFDTEEDYLHPRRKPIFAVKVDGADLVRVFEYPEFRELPDGTALPPLRQIGGRTEPGILVQEYSDQKFLTIVGKPSVWSALAFDCEANPFTNRAVWLRATGLLDIGEAGRYTLEIASDDDAALFLNEALVVVNTSGDTTRRRVRLSAGAYRLRLDYHNDVGPACLTVRWGPGEAAPTRILGVPSVVLQGAMP